MRSVIIISLISVSFILPAQDWLTKALGDAGAESKAKLDSIDFQFAISVNENAGFIDVEQKGEGWSRGFYSLKDENSKSKIDQARDILERAISYYSARWYLLLNWSLRMQSILWRATTHRRGNLFALCFKLWHWYICSNQSFSRH